MVEFETIKKEEVVFGDSKNKFVELARKKAITPEGENIFISLSSGFVTQDGERRYRKSFTVPLDGNVLDFIIENLKDMATE